MNNNTTQNAESNSFNLNLISKSRDFLFGLSIIFVVFHHLTFRYYEGILGKSYAYFRSMGAVGVDIFLFLSAVGLYYSFSKDENILTFYKRRLLRIFPTFLIIVVPWFYYYDIWVKGNYAWFFGHITSIGYWFKGAGDWFISAIILLYLLYPILYKYLYDKVILAEQLNNECNIYQNNKYSYLIILSLYGIFVLYLRYFFPDYYEALGQSLARFPIFVVGMFASPYIKSDFALPLKKTRIISFIILVVSMFCFGVLALKGKEYAYSYYGRYCFFPMSLAIIIIVSSFYKNSSNFINTFILFTGSLSLEIYLTNQRTIAISENIGKYFCFNQDYLVVFIENLVGVMLCIALSYLVQSLTLKIYNNKRNIMVNSLNTDEAIEEANKDDEKIGEIDNKNKESEELEKIILEYVEEDYHKRAIMIDGNWGVGKTYFMKNIMIPKLKEIPQYKFKGAVIYVSLYGISNKKELEESIIDGIIPVCEDIVKNDVFKDYCKKAKKATFEAIDERMPGVGSLINTTLSFITGRTLIKNLKAIIIFDDLERCSINIIDLLGIISSYIEQNNKKIIILSNEDKLIKREDEDKDNNTYLKEKEKTIGLTIKFNLKLRFCYEDIIEKNHLKQNTVTFLKNNSEAIIAGIEQFNNQNLRTFIDAIQVFDKVCQHLDYEKFRKSFKVSNKGLDNDTFNIFIKVHTIRLWKYVCNLIYNLGKCNEEVFVRYKSIDEYIRKGFFDENYFYKELNKYFKEYTNTQGLFLHSLEKSMTSLNKANIEIYLDKLKKEINSDYFSLLSLPKLMYIIKFYKDEGYDNDLDNDLINLFSKKKFDYKFKELLDYYEEKYKSIDAYYFNIIHKIKLGIEIDQFNNAEEMLDKAINSEWNEDFVDFCQKHASIYLKKGFFLSKINFEKAKENLNKSIKNICFFKNGLNFLIEEAESDKYSNYFYKSNETNTVYLLLKMINELIDKEENGIIKGNLKQLKETLEKYRKSVCRNVPYISNKEEAKTDNSKSKDKEQNNNEKLKGSEK